jgi:threonine aldolase
MAELEMERACSAEVAKWVEEVQQTKVRLMCRWEVQMAGLEQRIADELGVVLDWRLPCVEIE